MHRKSGAIAGRGRSRERGFVLVTMAVAAIALIGILGLAVDLGHIFISKNETQAYCDSAALAAALALDGTTAGITNAKAAVTNSTNGWNFSTASVSSPTLTFATAIAGPWLSNPNPADGYNHVRGYRHGAHATVLHPGTGRANRRQCHFDRDSGSSSSHFHPARFGALHRSQHR
jgi:Flp pilus assembly protein TadG